LYWEKAADNLPRDKETVLVRISSDYHLAVYEAEKKAFVTRNKKEIKGSAENLEWLKLQPPPNE
jgi:hypothetical protein